MIRRESRSTHPEAADALLIEVAESSLESDRTAKAALYAEAGIPDYWIVNLIDSQIDVYRYPQPGVYRSNRVHLVGD